MDGVGVLRGVVCAGYLFFLSNVPTVQDPPFSFRVTLVILSWRCFNQAKWGWMGGPTNTSSVIAPVPLLDYDRGPMITVHTNTIRPGPVVQLLHHLSCDKWYVSSVASPLTASIPSRDPHRNSTTAGGLPPSNLRLRVLEGLPRGNRIYAYTVMLFIWVLWISEIPREFR